MKQVLIDIWQAAVYVWNGKPKDPTEYAETPPKWWNGADPVEVPEADETIEIKEGGHPWGWAGEWLYDNGTTIATKEGNAALEKAGITAQDYGEMLVYRVSKEQVGLYNITLAGQIKPHWRQGKKPKEIGLLVGCSESTARHYCICFERSQKASNATPLSQ